MVYSLKKIRIHTSKIISLLACLWFASFTHSAYAELKVGVVDVQYLVDASPYTEYATELLRQEFDSENLKIQENRQLLDQMRRDFVASQQSLTEVQLKTRERRILTLERDIMRSESDFKELLALRKNEERFKVQEIIKEAIQALGVRDGYDLIFYSSLAYVNPEVNISEAVLTLVRQQFEQERASTTLQ